MPTRGRTRRTEEGPAWEWRTYQVPRQLVPGDVVIVQDSGERPVDPANGLDGWNLPWAHRRAGSAI